MSQTLYQDNKYKIKKNGRGYVLINLQGEYENHGHFKSIGICFKLIQMIEEGIVPNSNFLREGAIRISIDNEYTNRVKTKLEKDKNKPKYININKGLPATK